MLCPDAIERMAKRTERLAHKVHTEGIEVAFIVVGFRP